MAIWSADLTTEDGALGAAQMGSLACLISAGFAGFYLLVFAGVTAGSGDEVGGFLAGYFAAEFVVCALAAWLLRSGKGAIPAMVACVFIGLAVLGQLSHVSIIALIFDTVLLIFAINGVRGALALRRGIVNDEEVFS